MTQDDEYYRHNSIPSEDDYDDGNIPDEDLPQDSTKAGAIPKSLHLRRDGSQGN